MQIVIDISKNMYEAACGPGLPCAIVDDLEDAVKNGTVLPMQHGNLIDFDEVERLATDANRRGVMFALEDARVIVPATY